MKNTTIPAKPAKRSNTVSGILALAMGLTFSMALPLPLYAAQDDNVPLIPLVPPEPADIVGIWDYSTGQPSVSGHCPAGLPTRGQLAITYDFEAPDDPENVMEGGPISLDILSGSVCNPASLCHLKGAISGSGIAVGASATVDDEGGRAVVAWSLWFESNQSATGEATSNYTHPSGFTCDRTMDVRLTRTKD